MEKICDTQPVLDSLLSKLSSTNGKSLKNLGLPKREKQGIS